MQHQQQLAMSPTPLLRLLLLFVTMFLVLLSALLISPALNSTVNLNNVVTHLPGFSGALPFLLQTGYESVDGAELFYYFVPSERNPGKDPLILWLTGSPGCSALSALLMEVGPLQLVIAEYYGSIPSLKYNPNSWTKIANILFVDAPVGTGFSFSINATAYVADDTTLSLQVSNFLVKWYDSHPSFLSNPLYIAGNSYSGKIAPTIAHGIVTSQLNQLFSNLKGYIIGNPRLNRTFDIPFQVQFAHSMGMISDEHYKVIKDNCEGEIYDNVNPSNVPCYKALTDFHQVVLEINCQHILDPVCPSISMIANRRSLGMKESRDFLVPPHAPDIKCRDDYADYLSYHWANNELTREALHIKKGTVREWQRCSHSLAYTENIPSTLKYHHHLIQRGYRALIYSGDYDLLIPFNGTHTWVKSLNFPIVDDWRSWHVDGQVAGYTRKFMNDLTFATVKNAGHIAPTYQPENCFAMFSRWISHKSL